MQEIAGEVLNSFPHSLSDVAMSDKKADNPIEEDSSNPEKPEEQSLDVRINRSTNEMSIRDPQSGNRITFKAFVEEEPEEEEEDNDKPPLTFEQFQEVFQKLDSMGLTWSPEVLPQLRSKAPEKDLEGALIRAEIDRLSTEFPHFPHELGTVIYYVLTGGKSSLIAVGSDEVLEQKAQFVRDNLITAEYRSEFFFKYAIKVPYFSDMDWEVVIKAFERGVKGSPGLAYALLSLSFHGPNRNPWGGARNVQNVTVAVNKHLVDRLITHLVQVRNALNKAEGLIQNPRLETKNANSDESKQLGDGDTEKTN